MNDHLTLIGFKIVAVALVIMVASMFGMIAEWFLRASKPAPSSTESIKGFFAGCGLWAIGMVWAFVTEVFTS